MTLENLNEAFDSQSRIIDELRERIKVLEAVRDAAEAYLLSGAPDYPAKFERLSEALKAARSGE